MCCLCAFLHSYLTGGPENAAGEQAFQLGSDSKSLTPKGPYEGMWLYLSINGATFGYELFVTMTLYFDSLL
jgi:hypothetical protein